MHVFICSVCIQQNATPQHCIFKAIWQMQLAISLHIPTEAKLCLKPPVTAPETGSIGHQLLPLLNSQGRTVDVILPDGNCLFRSISKVLFATSSGHLTLRKLIVDFIESNPRYLGGLCNGSLQNHCQQMRKAGTFGTQAELQAASFLFQIPVYLFQKPNATRDWEWMVYNPQAKSNLDFSTCPHIHVAALQSPTNFHIEILYKAVHFDVIVSLQPNALLPPPTLPRSDTCDYVDLSV